MRQRRILVIDDDPSFYPAISRILKTAGYGVKSVGDGRAAVTAFRSDQPDLALVAKHESGSNADTNKTKAAPSNKDPG